MDKIIISFGSLLSLVDEFADRLDARNVPPDVAAGIPVVLEGDAHGNRRATINIPLRYSRGGRRVQ